LLLRRWLNGPRAHAVLTHRIIPCLDVRDGRVVKGVRFQGLRDAGDPASAARRYERRAPTSSSMLDVSATPEGRATQADTVRRVRAVLGIPLTVGGGVRNAENAGHLLEAGADKVGVNTAAVERPALLSQIADALRRAVHGARARRRPRADGPRAGWEVVVQSGKRPHRPRRGRLGARGRRSAAPARSCSRAGTATARARATTLRCSPRSRAAVTCR
jgi:imidazole glycerol phosphate synthase subunit HisF